MNSFIDAFVSTFESAFESAFASINSTVNTCLNTRMTGFVLEPDQQLCEHIVGQLFERCCEYIDESKRSVQERDYLAAEISSRDCFSC